MKKTDSKGRKYPMERHGFIQDMMDVKVLILFVAARLNGPASVQEIYELCYQDERLSYFDVCTAVPELVRSGHLQQLPGDRYGITEKGKAHGALTEDSLAFPVQQRAQEAVDRFNREQRRSGMIQAEIVRRQEEGDYVVKLGLNDEKGTLMRLELMAPDQPQAIRLSRSFRKNAELIYHLIMADLLDETDFGE